MKAWTVSQPFASLMIMGAMPYVHAKKPTPAGLIEERVVIYADPAPMAPYDIIRTHENVMFENSAFTSIVADLAAPLLTRLREDMERGARASRVPLGQALGTIRIGRAKRLAECFPDDPEVNPAIWAWPLFEPLAFERPISAVAPPADFWEWKR